MFITFEGPEGCGKSTHSRKLKAFLEKKGHSVLLTCEPGGTRIGKMLRDILLRPDSVFDNMTEFYLFSADRSEHAAKIIIPALKEGKTVICDRFIDSTIAYQVGGRNLPEDMVRYNNMVSSKGLIPDLTFILDVSPTTGLKRAGQKGAADRFEGQALAFHQRVRKKYLQIAAREAHRVKLIGTEDIAVEAVQNIIREIINEKLGN